MLRPSATERPQRGCTWAARDARWHKNGPLNHSLAGALTSAHKLDGLYFADCYTTCLLMYFTAARAHTRQDEARLTVARGGVPKTSLGHTRANTLCADISRTHAFGMCACPREDAQVDIPKEPRACVPKPPWGRVSPGQAWLCIPKSDLRDAHTSQHPQGRDLRGLYPFSGRPFFRSGRACATPHVCQTNPVNCKMPNKRCSNSRLKKHAPFEVAAPPAPRMRSRPNSTSTPESEGFPPLHGSAWQTQLKHRPFMITPASTRLWQAPHVSLDTAVATSWAPSAAAGMSTCAPAFAVALSSSDGSTPLTVPQSSAAPSACQARCRSLPTAADPSQTQAFTSRSSPPTKDT